MTELIRHWVGVFVGHEMPPFTLLHFFGSYPKAIAESKYVSINDVYLVVAYTVVWLGIFYSFQRLVARPLARYYLPDSMFMDKPSEIAAAEARSKGRRKDAKAAAAPVIAPADDKPVLNKTRRADLHRKFETAVWKASSFIFTSILGSYVFFTKWWAMDPRDWWTPEDIEWDLRHFYLFDLAFWFLTCILLKFEPVLKDRNQMWFHHVVTIGLILNSYIIGHCQVGLAIMILHDLSDPLMETAKLFNYRGMAGGANLFFVLFMIAFYFLRLYILPFTVIWSVLHDLSNVTSPRMNQPIHGFWLFIILLNALQILHVFWAVLIAKIAASSIFSGGVKGDSRED